MTKRTLAAGLLFLIMLPRFSAASPPQQCTEIPIPCLSGSPHSACVITHCTPVVTPRAPKRATRPPHPREPKRAERSPTPKRAASSNDCVKINTAPGVPGGVGCPVFPNRPSPVQTSIPETPDPPRVAVPQPQITPAPGPFSSMPIVPSSPPGSDDGPRTVPLEPFRWPQPPPPNSQQIPSPGPFTSMPLPPPAGPNSDTDATAVPVSAAVLDSASIRQRHHRPIDCENHKGEVAFYVADFHYGPHGSNKLPDAATLTYEGQRADDFHWVQFVWREKLVTKRVNVDGRNGTMTLPADDFYTPARLGGEKRRFTFDRDHPIYYVDVLRPGLKRGNRPEAGPIVVPTSASPTSPAYFGENVRNSQMLRALDTPGASFCPHANQRDVTRVESKAHFDTFLVLNGHVCAKISWHVTHVWTLGDPRACDRADPSHSDENFLDPPPIYDASDPDITGAAPNADQMTVLKYTHPGQELLE